MSQPMRFDPGEAGFGPIPGQKGASGGGRGELAPKARVGAAGSGTEQKERETSLETPSINGLHRGGRIGLLLSPLDLLFFRGGFTFGEGAHVRSLLPTPQTLAGAIRSWLLRELGFDFLNLPPRLEAGLGFREALALEEDARIQAVGRLLVRGPWLAKVGDDGSYEPLVRTPATLQRTKEMGGRGKLYRFDPLRPEELPGWHPFCHALWPLWARRGEPGEAAGGYLRPDGLSAFLKGGLPEAGHVVKEGDLLGRASRTGIGMDPDRRTVAEGRIYVAEMLALKEGVAFYGEIAGETGDLELVPDSGVARFGGEARQVRVSRVPAHPWPDSACQARHPEAKGGRALLALLTAPAIFSGGWQPDEAPGELISAAVPGHEAVSGWDLARRGPKPTRFALPAGSVFFFRQNAGTFPASLPDSLCTKAEAELGWGSVVYGGWNHV